ncbi:MAG: putative ABC transport system ATP-binding protein [Limisphaerales bacterium]|jgi:putative ABC transport system ATP-binding protein
MLRVNTLSKSFIDGDQQVRVLEDLSFDLHEGASLAVTGPSGSGKSTLLNILAGMLLPDAGHVWLGQQSGETEISDVNERARTKLRRSSIGYIHQFFNLIPTLTVRENVLLPAELNKLADAQSRTDELLERVGLLQKAFVYPDALSGGQQQRVAVARGLVLKPALVLADEPTGNLDQENARLVSELLFTAAKEQNTMLVVATHSDYVASSADQRLHLANLD